MADLERAARAIEAFLDALGHPVDSDPELAETGSRVALAFATELLDGYSMDPERILADTTATDAPGMVVVTNVLTTAMCPHHLLPAPGVVHVGYLPNDRVVGLGALGRLVGCYARRLALQEDVGRNIASALVDVLGARGAGVVLDLAPTCLTTRGGRHHGARAVTHAFSGALNDDAGLRAEFLAAVACGRRE